MEPLDLVYIMLLLLLLLQKRFLNLDYKVIKKLVGMTEVYLSVINNGLIIQFGFVTDYSGTQNTITLPISVNMMFIFASSSQTGDGFIIRGQNKNYAQIILKMDGWASAGNIRTDKYWLVISFN